MVRLLFVCGSPRKGATAYVVEQARLGALEVPDVEVDILELRKMNFSGCVGCNACVTKGITECIRYQDDMSGFTEKFWNYDGFLLASPVYGMGLTPLMINFTSRFRAEYLNISKDPFLRMYKPAAAIAVGGTRNGGQENAIQNMHGFFHTHGMPVVNGAIGIYSGTCVWSNNRMAEGAAEDVEGIKNARLLAKKLALTAVAFSKSKD